MSARQKFSESEIQNWRQFEKVRKGGKYNMYDSRAVAATKLAKDDYVFVMKNYSALKDAADKAAPPAGIAT